MQIMVGLILIVNGVFEVDDNISMEEIDEMVWQWAIERVGINWEVVE